MPFKTTYATAAATYDNSIRDTLKLSYAVQTIYKDQNDNYIAVLQDGTEKDVTPLLANAGRTLIEDSEGNQMAVTGDHRLMSAEQYHKTGKNNTLLKNDSQAKDKQIAASGEVIFMPSGNQQYGFDAYDASTNNHPEIYPLLEGGSYRPAYKSVAQWQQDKVTADPMDGVTFRTQMGVPYAKANGEILLRGEPIAGETPVYAHMAETDSTTKVVGKLNLLTFEPREINVCLVPVNGATLPNVQTLEKELNKIFKPAVASVKLSTHSGITIDYADGSGFVHGGSGSLTVYSDDEKAAINALTDANDDTYYLFLVSSVTKLDADGNRTIVSGYMPVGYQHGFIFEQFNVVRTFAHELLHGAFALHHTFSANTESFRADEGTTTNLMDYTEHGTTLNHKQWRWMHEKHSSGLFGFLADEEEGEMVIENSTRALARIIKTINCAYNNGEKNVRLYLPSSTITSNVSDLVSELYLAGNPCAKNAKLKATLYTMFGQAIDLSNNYIDDVYSLENIEYNENAKVITLTGNDYKLLIAGENDASNVYDFAKENLFGSLHIPKTSINFASLDDLQYSSPCELQYLSIDNRKKILQNIQSETNWYNNSLKDSRQKITINLIATTPKGDRGELLSFFYSNPSILKTLYDRVDDYRCEFIDELNNVYTDGLENISDRKIVAVGLQPGVMEQRTPWYEDLSFMWGYLYTIKNHTYAKYEADDKISVYIKKYRGVSLGLEALMADGQLLCEGHPFDVIRGVEIESKKQIDIPLFYFLYKTQEGETDAIYKDINAIGATTVDIALMTFGLKSLSGASELLKSEVTARNITRLILGFGDISTLGLDKICEDETSDFCQAYKKYEFYINMGLLSANVLNEFPKIINGLSKGLDNPKLLPKQKEELKAILGETSTKTAKYADNLTGELKKTYEELIAVFASEEKKVVECIDNGKSIVFRVSESRIPLLEISNGKFMVKKWGAHYNGKVEKELDNGYWLIKNEEGYSIDLGFKEGRKLTGKEVNEYYKGIHKDPPYTDDCVVTEEILNPGKEFYMVINGFVEKGGVNSTPRIWASNDAITTIKELREDMAVLERWKKLELVPTRAKYTVKQELRVRNGVVGPQVDFPIDKMTYNDETKTILFNPVLYKGGNQQYELIISNDMNWRNNGWTNYLKELERVELK